MTHVQSFDSFEDMQTYMRERTDAANAALLPAQIDLRDDDTHTRYWVQPYPEGGFLIFGRTPSWKEMAERSAKYAPDQADLDSEDLDEAVWEIRNLAPRRADGYLSGEAFSVVEPNGELGDTHVSQVYPISEEAFEEARNAGWKAIEVTSLDLDLMGEDAARQGGWTPTLVAELRAIQESVQAQKEGG